MFPTNEKENQKGVVLYLTIVLMAFMTSILLVLANLAINQTKNIYTSSDSVAAFYAADTGIEETLYKLYKDHWVPPAVNNCFLAWQDLFTNFEYQVCTSDTSIYKIWSTGRAKKTGTQRKIEIDMTP